MNLKFSTLVNLYENDVYTLALYLTRDRAEAEDMAQEAYMKLWKNLDQVEMLRAKSWLMKVTRNACLDRLRRRGLDRDVQYLAPQTDRAAGPADILERERRSEWLRAAIGTLQEPYRTMIILRDIHQHSYRDISRTLELSLEQVKVYLHRARGQLRSVLGEVET